MIHIRTSDMPQAACKRSDFPLLSACRTTMLRFSAFFQAVCLVATVSFAADSPSFENEIKPIFAAKCIACHNSKKPASGLSVEVPEAILRGGNLNGAAIVPGNSAESPLMLYLRGEKKPAMPFGQAPLAPADLARIAKWIDTLKPPERDAGKQRPWPFSKLEPPTVPTVRQQAWVKNPIDAFILAKLESKGLEPAPPVSR